MIQQQIRPSERPRPLIIRRDIDGDRLREAESAGLSGLSARVMAARPESLRPVTAGKHAAPSLADLDDPQLMADMSVAAERLAMAVMTGEHIALETDHDVDGVSSHAVLKHGLMECCRHPETHIHSFIGHRLKEGYGLSQSVAQRIREHPQRCDLVITADNGSADEERIQYLLKHGIETIVTDHHAIPAGGIPQSAVAVLNPTRDDCGYPDPLIAGCLVAWLLLVQTIRTLEDYGHLRPGEAEPARLLDFVAVGTVADCVSMARSLNNRAVVRYGLRLINDASRPVWETTLGKLSKEAVPLTEQDIGFGLGPRINARGRLDEAMAGVHFLLSRSREEAAGWWDVLNEENESRKEIERKLKEEAMRMAGDMVSQGVSGLALWLKNGHPGVHGIVASRVVEAYGRPTLCLSPVHESEELVTGSARSIPGFHVKNAFDWIQERRPGIFIKAGGHEGAGGLTIRQEQMTDLIEAWDQAVAAQTAEKGLTLSPVIFTDGNLLNPSLDDVFTLEAELAPFGREFEQPVWEGEFRIMDVKPRGDGSHLAVTLSNSGGIFQGIWFNARETASGGALGPVPVSKGQTVRLCFAIENNRYLNRDRLQLRIITAEVAS